jgi:hypothetical protein
VFSQEGSAQTVVRATSTRRENTLTITTKQKDQIAAHARALLERHYH